MIGIVIVAHGGLADEMLNAAQHIVGDLPGAKAIGLGPREDLTAARARIEAAVGEVDAGAGVVVLTDLFGGTPSNLALAAMSTSNADVITGVNLPLIIKLAKSRNLPRAQAAAAAVAAGRQYILDAAEMLNGSGPRPRDAAGAPAESV